ncbi:MAG TPA: AAA family ATPase [Spirochaetota bacterium]|jgi:chromosome partitioning protein|nr:ParA family protein [Spirochaetota bacterium]OQA95854.1 MAG: Sporulation initiation inhibitor protein Soj [Spirochaetes bacterium ADurb.Bin218]HOK01651.1 AAA family ATPase [Spirochaetota bacterium]HOK91802.1 AAA family ATPase [Spirochaetota bacterium]HON15176.1 AAA family ATPase [Spirochaetota bacterium]
MGKIISVSNQKGGVGKTTTTVNVAAFLAEKGKRVLVIDIDPQGNAGFGLGINAEEMETTIYEVLIDEIPVEDAIFKTDIPGLSIIPSNIHLSGAQVDLLDVEGKEFILKKKLQHIKNHYDFIFIDCPPSLGILTLNSLVAADSVLIPLQCEYYALEGINQLLRIIVMVQENLNKSLKIEGVILTMYDPRTNLSQQVVSDVREFFQDKVFDSIIPRNVKLSEAPSFGKPIGLYDRVCPGSIAYEKLADEVLANE